MRMVGMNPTMSNISIRHIFNVFFFSWLEMTKSLCFWLRVAVLFCYFFLSYTSSLLFYWRPIYLLSSFRGVERLAAYIFLK